jgi:alpha-beta hydrolase superfamily lysophospholipase
VSQQLVLNSFSNIDFKKPHAPLLFIGGGSDNIFPPRLTQNIAERYRDEDSRIDIKIFENKSHFICGEPGWEKVADYILNWYESL